MRRCLLRGRYVLLVVTATVVVASLLTPRPVDFDRKVVNLIADESGVLDAFRKLKRSFGGNEIVLAAYRDDNLLNENKSGIQRLAEISERLESIEGVRSTLSLDKLDTSLIPISSKTNPFAIRMRELFEGYTHNADGDIGVVVCMLKPEEQTSMDRQRTIDLIREVMHDLPGELPDGMITGEPVMLVDGYRYVEQDGQRLSLWSSVLLGATVLVCFRSLRWTIICVGVVQLALLLTRTSMAALGMRLSMVSSMLTAVATVVGVATVVHLIVRFREAREQRKSPLRSLAQTTKFLLVPVFWACVTDAAGFGALKSASVGPVGDFGVMMGISCIAVLASVWLLVPGLATIGPHPPVSETQQNPRLRVALSRLADGVARHGLVLGGTALLVVAFALAGLRFLEVETDFTRNFRGRTKIVSAYRFVEANLGGAGVGDILIPAPDHLGWEFLRKVRHFEDRIRAESQEAGPLKGITKVLSLADAVLVGAPHLKVDQPTNIQSEFLTRSGLAVMRARIPSFYDALHAQDPESAEGTYYLRIMFRAREQQDAEKKKALIRRIEALGAECFPDAREPVQVTGFFVLLTFLIDSIVGDQWTTFSIALAGIGITMLLAFRSVPLALIALVPNALPVLIVSGCMGWMNQLGWFDFRINMGSAMIAAVSLGLSIDSSIHYIFAYQRARQSGKSLNESIQSAHGTVGLSMIFATIALIVGFSVLATSNFTPTVYFGTLVSLAMLGGLLGNLVVLPLMLRVVHRS